MQQLDLQIIPSGVLSVFQPKLPEEALVKAFDQLHDAPLSTDGFRFYNAVAAVYSSKIEGEPIELDSYIKYKRFQIELLPDFTRKIDDLYLAYQFASTKKPDKTSIAEMHAQLAQHIVPAHWLGKFRNQNMYVTTKDGRIEYVAASPFEVVQEMEKFYADLEKLLATEMTVAEAFYFASMVHLVFVKIHPWNDGNGRSARLLEKWFLAEKLGPKAWFVQSEKYYYLHHNTYYANIRALGLEYPSLDYSKALPFALMLPNSVLHAE